MLGPLAEYLKSNFQQDKSRVILWYPALLALGIALYFALPQEPSKWLTLGLIEGLIVLAVMLRRHLTLLKILAALAVVLAGFTLIQVKSIYLYAEPENLPDHTFYFRGEIAAIDSNYQGRRRFTLQNLEDFDGRRYIGKYRIVQRSKKGEAKVGECVEMIGRIMPLAKAVVPGGYQFDRKSYFAGLKGSGFAESRWFKIDCPHGERERGFASFVADVRQKIVNRINSLLAPDEAAIAAAVIAGERGLIGRRLNEQYRDSGLAHFLSISGLHMSMLAGLMFFLVRFVLALFPPVALRLNTKKIAAVLAIVVSLIYLLISGMEIPAQRAFIMTFVVLLGVLTDRRAISMQTIALAAFLVLLISPEVLTSASFQMSFAAVLGLIAFYEKVESKVRRFLHVDGMNKWLRAVWLYIIGVVVSDFIASLMTLPFAVYHFNMVALYTTLGNFLAGPVIGLVIMPFVLLGLLLLPFGLDAPFIKIVGLGISWVNEITAWVASLPYAGYQVPSLPHWGLMMIVAGGLWLMLWQAGWRRWGWLGIIVGVLSLLTVRVPDIMISADLKTVAFKNADGRLELVSSRGGRFVKNVWQSKYPFAETKTTLKAHPELKIEGRKATVANVSYDMNRTLGVNLYKNPDGSFSAETVRDAIGCRLWNK